MRNTLHTICTQKSNLKATLVFTSLHIICFAACCTPLLDWMSKKLNLTCFVKSIEMIWSESVSVLFKCSLQYRRQNKFLLCFNPIQCQSEYLLAVNNVHWTPTVYQINWLKKKKNISKNYIKIWIDCSSCSLRRQKQYGFLHFGAIP